MDGGAVLVLAAGRSQRFRCGPKQVAVVGGRPLLHHVVDAALATSAPLVVVVLGHDHQAVGEVLPDDPRLRTVVNRDYAEGQARSLRAGLSAFDEEVKFAVVLLGDQPSVSAEAIGAVASAIRRGARVARAAYDDGPSHPVGFAREVWPQLTAIDGDTGARVLFDRLPVADVPVSGPRPRDIDTAEDLEEFNGT